MSQICTISNYIEALLTQAKVSDFSMYELMHITELLSDVQNLLRCLSQAILMNSHVTVHFLGKL